jgi:hypothetical protein
MHSDNRSKLVMVLIIISFPLFFSACGTSGGTVIVEYEKDSKYRQPQVIKRDRPVVKQSPPHYAPAHGYRKKQGPPPHAPAHGYRAKYRYRYYPAQSVYFDDGRKIYFYLQANRWRGAATLPNNLHMRLGSYVVIEMNTDKPYTHYKAHKRNYPPGQLKKKKQKKLSKTK